MAQSVDLGRDKVAADISALLALQPAALQNISATASTVVKPQRNGVSATKALDNFTPSATSPDQSQNLSRAYVHAMRNEVLITHQRGGGEVVASRLDELRTRGQGVVEALSDVKV